MAQRFLTLNKVQPQLNMCWIMTTLALRVAIASNDDGSDSSTKHANTRTPQWWRSDNLSSWPGSVCYWLEERDLRCLFVFFVVQWILLPGFELVPFPWTAACPSQVGPKLTGGGYAFPSHDTSETKKTWQNDKKKLSNTSHIWASCNLWLVVMMIIIFICKTALL
jgi:hypothetical protein